MLRGEWGKKPAVVRNRYLTWTTSALPLSYDHRTTTNPHNPAQVVWYWLAQSAPGNGHLHLLLFLLHKLKMSQFQPRWMREIAISCWVNRQYSTTELRPPDNHQPLRPSIHTAQVVLTCTSAPVAHPATTTFSLSSIFASDVSVSAEEDVWSISLTMIVSTVAMSILPQAVHSQGRKLDYLSHKVNMTW